MPVMDTVGHDVTFRTRLFGFDRHEVRAFIANLLEDLESARNRGAGVEREGPKGESVSAWVSDTTAREVQRVLESAHRVAVDIERDAAEASARMVAEARAQAADVLVTAQRQADDITEGARRELNRLEVSAAALRGYCLRLRSGFEAAADTAGLALSEIAAISADPEVGESREVGSESTTGDRGSLTNMVEAGH
jgi:cell division septum initiation protein DivIVA